MNGVMERGHLRRPRLVESHDMIYDEDHGDYYYGDGYIMTQGECPFEADYRGSQCLETDDENTSQGHATEANYCVIDHGASYPHMRDDTPIVHVDRGDLDALWSLNGYVYGV